MKIKISVPSIIILLSIVSTVSSCGETPYAPKGKPDYSSYEQENTMRISGWVGPYHENLGGKGNPDFITEKYYQAMSEAGMTAIYDLYNMDDGDTIVESCRLAHQYGMKFYARSSTVYYYQTDVQEYVEGQFANDPVISRYKNLPGFGGHLVRDEPTAHSFEALAANKTFYNQELPYSDWYVNLNPMYASMSYLGVRYYEDYVQQYVDIVKPEYVSFDHYSLMVSSDGKDYYPKSTTLQNREIVAEICREANIPYMNFTMICSGPSGEPRHVTEESELRWQIMQDLAYGCTGIQYFCVFTPGASNEHFTDGMFDFQGRKTVYYDYAKNINGFIKNIDAAFMNFKWDGTITVNGSSYDDYDEPDSFYVLKEYKEHPGLNYVKSNRHTVVGCFTSKVDDYNGYIINNYEDPYYKIKDKVTVSFKGANKALLYRGTTIKTVSLNNGKLSLTLDPGEGVFVIPFNS